MHPAGDVPIRGFRAVAYGVENQGLADEVGQEVGNAYVEEPFMILAEGDAHHLRHAFQTEVFHCFGRRINR